MKAVIEENVTAGVAMSRRAVYMYREVLRFCCKVFKNKLNFCKNRVRRIIHEIF